MRFLRTRDEIDLGPRPLLYFGWFDREHLRPSSFPYKPGELQAPAEHFTARLDYRAGWTTVILWNSELYFADEILTFDAMMELIRSRFDRLALKAPIMRDYPSEHC